MKLSEMKNRVSGLPDGFDGVKMSWDEVKETFEIKKACILERDKKDDLGQPILYKQGPKQGQPIPDRQVAFAIETVSGKSIIVRTNSARLTLLYSGDLDREPDETNRFGDRIYHVEVPEGRMMFVPYEQKATKDGREMKWNIADLEEVEE